MYLHIQSNIDRPMVMIADRTRFDRGQPSGVWLDLNWSSDQLTETCRRAGLVPATMIVVDQVGLGPVMLDEDLGLIELVARYQSMSSADPF